MDTCETDLAPVCTNEYYFGVTVDTSATPRYGQPGEVKEYPYLCEPHTEQTVARAMVELQNRRCSSDTITIRSVVGAF